jgi:hypothetical protein
MPLPELTQQLEADDPHIDILANKAQRVK